MRSTPAFLFSVTIIAVALSAGCVAPQSGPQRGAALYDGCRACHGDHGEGNQTLRAPAIAALDAWYIEGQLMAFRSGHRGTHPQDEAGMRMRPMALALRTDADIKDVAQYVAQLSPQNLATAAEQGDVARGQAAYATCMACHGAEGLGNPALKAPSLRTQPPWYLKAQVQNFRAGIRGAHPSDTSGASMRAIAQTLQSQQQVDDVVAFILTLRK